MAQRFTFNLGGPSVPPGTLPSYLLDQREQWVTPQGVFVRIENMDLEFLTFVIDYLLAHARRLRDGWATEQRQTYDTSQKARVWMLQRPVMLELMRRYVEAHD